MKVTIIGTGYVGLVTGACFAQMGNDVLCLDVDRAKVEMLNGGGIPIYEPGLEELVRENHQAGRLGFTTDVKRSVEHGDVQFIAVGTPPNGDGSADLGNALVAAGNIARFMTEPKIIVNKSTVPVGTADRVKRTIARELKAKGAEVDFAVISNPEFLKEGAAVDDFMRPDRIIIGGGDQHAIEVLRELYGPLSRNHDKVMVMDARSAELTKYAANAMLATRISFMNELANLAEELGVDIENVRRGIGSDPRIGYHFLYPGAGYGGSCFPKDVKALIHTARNTTKGGLRILEAVEAVNAQQKQVLFGKVSNRFGEDLAGRHFAIWGLAFKPNTDDIREAASVPLIASLLDAGASVTAYDPAAMNAARAEFGERDNLWFSPGPMRALSNADALIIVTEWAEFRSPDFLRIKNELKQAIIFDGRNLFSPTRMNKLGIEHHPIGRSGFTPKLSPTTARAAA
jgi:UDPglucose 6-dehydrogenase